MNSGAVGMRGMDDWILSDKLALGVLVYISVIAVLCEEGHVYTWFDAIFAVEIPFHASDIFFCKRRRCNILSGNEI